MKQTYKIVFVGAPGSGKTTSIACLSDAPPVTTEAECTDELVHMKQTTTVAFDFGELDLGPQGRLLLYGLPGQARFSFMFDVVRAGLLGAVVLVDAQSDTAVEGLDTTLAIYAAEFRKVPCVVCLNRHPEPGPELLQRCHDVVRRHGIVAPVFAVDARRRKDVVRMFELLFVQLEYGSFDTGTDEELAWH